MNFKGFLNSLDTEFVLTNDEIRRMYYSELHPFFCCRETVIARKRCPKFRRRYFYWVT